MTNNNELDQLLFFFERHSDIELEDGCVLAGILVIDFPKPAQQGMPIHPAAIEDGRARTDARRRDDLWMEGRKRSAGRDYRGRSADPRMGRWPRLHDVLKGFVDRHDCAAVLVVAGDDTADGEAHGVSPSVMVWEDHSPNDGTIANGLNDQPS